VSGVDAHHMIVFTHRPSPIRGWKFESDVGDLDGAGGTLEQSMDCSEHVARHYFTLRGGYAVLPEDARHRVHHVIQTRAAPPSQPNA
jgi:hypothetical protein